MHVKFDVGQTVVLKAEVMKINVDKEGVKYSIRINGKKSVLQVSESELAVLPQRKEPVDGC